MEVLFGSHHDHSEVRPVPSPAARSRTGCRCGLPAPWRGWPACLSVPSAERPVDAATFLWNRIRKGDDLPELRLHSLRYAGIGCGHAWRWHGGRRWLARAPPSSRPGSHCPSCRWSSGRDGRKGRPPDCRRDEDPGRVAGFQAPRLRRIPPLDLACSSCMRFAGSTVLATRGEGLALDVRVEPEPTRR